MYKCNNKGPAVVQAAMEAENKCMSQVWMFLAEVHSLCQMARIIALSGIFLGSNSKSLRHVNKSSSSSVVILGFRERHLAENEKMISAKNIKNSPPVTFNSPI